MSRLLSDSGFWNSILGHQEQCARLLQVADSGRIPHALLFTGPEGVGKRHIALSFASLLLQGIETRDTAHDEKIAALLRSGNHPDFHLVARPEDKKDIPVDEIRNLREIVHLRPYSSPCRVVVINDAHEMSISASNSLLTTLEEPNPESYLILVSHAPQRLPTTILSRCQTLPFGLLGQEDVQQIIHSVLQRAGKAELSNQKELFALCHGSLEPLQLHRFIDARTSELKETSALLRHLEELLNETTRIRDLARNALSKDNDAQRACVLATELASKDLDSRLVWYALRLELREKLRTSPNAEKAFWSDMILHSLDAEKLCRERNANQQLQLTSMLLRGCSANT